MDPSICITRKSLNLEFNQLRASPVNINLFVASLLENEMETIETLWSTHLLYDWWPLQKLLSSFCKHFYIHSIIMLQRSELWIPSSLYIQHIGILFHSGHVRSSNLKWPRMMNSQTSYTAYLLQTRYIIVGFMHVKGTHYFHIQ